MSDDSNNDGMDDVVDAEIIDETPGTDLELYTDGEVEVAQPVITVTVEDLEAELEAELDPHYGHNQATGDAAAAARGGGGGRGLGGGKVKRRKGFGGGGGGFTLFGFTLNVSALNGWGSGNSASLIGGRAERKAKAAKLTRGGKHGSAGAMQRRMVRSRWLDRALGGGR